MDEAGRSGPQAPRRPRASVFVADEQSEDPPLDTAVLERLRRLASHVLADRRVPEAMELSVLCVDRADISRLNEHHMGQQGPTDVLAFPIDLPGETMPGEPALLGDVILCPSVAAEQAEASSPTSAIGELEVLTVHGILHLLGHDHAESDERAAMFGLTDQLLAAFRSAEDTP